jgi:cardiolipin synthase (CMP-forming)
MTNLPNILTVSRIFILPVIIALFFLENDLGEAAMWSALALYAIAALTDFFDGWLARKWKITSSFGTFMDPVSDKIFVAALLVTFIAFGRLPDLWIIPVLAILIREFMVSGLREFLGPKNVQMPVTKLAKWKTATQMFSLGFLIIGPYVPYTLEAGQFLLIAAAIIAVITGGQYLKAGMPYLK